MATSTPRRESESRKVPCAEAEALKPIFQNALVVGQHALGLPPPSRVPLQGSFRHGAVPEKSLPFAPCP